MTLSFELGLIIVSAIFLMCIVFSKISDRFGIPILILFIGVGMLAGSEGFGGIYFDDPELTQYIGIAALSVILFSGGLDTRWSQVKSVLIEGVALSIVGVLITSFVFGVIAYLVTGLSFLESLLIGAIISSTDAAAVFSILRSKGINLKQRLASVLEFESGSNDPVAVLLTIIVLGFITKTYGGTAVAITGFFQQIGMGLIVGWLLSKGVVYLINRINFGYEGLYNIFLFTVIFLTYGSAVLLRGSGFLAVYVLGLALAKSDFIHKRSTLRFFDSAAWFSQIVLFLTLGLLVFPSRLVPIMPLGIGLAVILMFLARPTAIFLTLLPFKYSMCEKLFISWVGLRGAVPIVLATYPLVAGIENSGMIFNIVFFVVLLSVLLQGTSLPIMAKWLKVTDPSSQPRRYPIEITAGGLIPSELKEIKLSPDSPAVGKAIYQLGLPPGFLVVLISRQDAFIQPLGNTVLQAGDELLALTEKDAFETAKSILNNEVVFPSFPS